MRRTTSGSRDSCRAALSISGSTAIAIWLARAALRGSGRRVGQDRDAAELHGLRRVDQSDGARGRGPVSEAGVRAVFLHDIEVDREDPSVLPEAHSDPALEALSPLQKQVLRMGPENAARLKRYVADMAVAMGRGSSDE